jgi:hypothetical protein
MINVSHGAWQKAQLSLELCTNIAKKITCNKSTFWMEQDQ